MLASRFLYIDIDFIFKACIDVESYFVCNKHTTSRLLVFLVMRLMEKCSHIRFNYLQTTTIRIRLFSRVDLMLFRVSFIRKDASRNLKLLLKYMLVLLRGISLDKTISNYMCK